MRLTLLLPLLVLCVLCGCAPKNASLKDQGNPLLSGNSWEVNRAVMLAGERSDNLDVALNAGEAELAARPDNAEARIILARLQSRAGRPEQALTQLAFLSPTAAELPEVRLEIARAHIAANQPEQALQALESIAGAQGEAEREARRLQAVAQDISGNHSGAQELYRGLLAEREDAAVRFNYGRSLVASGNFPAAASALISLADNPRFPQARILAAGALFKSGDRGGARNLLEGYLSKAEIDALLKK